MKSRSTSRRIDGEGKLRHVIKTLPIRPIHVRGLADESFSGLHDRFAERRMRMDAVGEVAGDGGGLDGEHSFGDQLTRANSDDANAENAFGFVFDDQLREPFGSTK